MYISNKCLNVSSLRLETKGFVISVLSYLEIRKNLVLNFWNQLLDVQNRFSICHKSIWTSSQLRLKNFDLNFRVANLSLRMCVQVFS